MASPHGRLPGRETEHHLGRTALRGIQHENARVPGRWRLGGRFPGFRCELRRDQRIRYAGYAREPAGLFAGRFILYAVRERQLEKPDGGHRARRQHLRFLRRHEERCGRWHAVLLDRALRYARGARYPRAHQHGRNPGRGAPTQGTVPGFLSGDHRRERPFALVPAICIRSQHRV